SQNLIQRLSGQDTQQLWNSNIFGKSVYELIQEGLNSKLIRTPEDLREGEPLPYGNEIIWL
ncbi:MAG: hypothetical protein IIX25_01640, partial [Clostridia bacterium]|nr:hypothetical protein [Clostridia bacterium]